ncbi:MAG: hypothetical protein KC609_05535 [Myxococcales bacterium]|nr:hypothetical protein [Myxococcales bacterium]
MKAMLVVITAAFSLALPGPAAALSCIGFPFDVRVQRSKHVVVVQVIGPTTRAGKPGFTMRVLKHLKGGDFARGQSTFFYAQGEGWERRAFRPGGIYILLLRDAPRPERCNYPIQIK